MIWSCHLIVLLHVDISLFVCSFNIFNYFDGAEGFDALQWLDGCLEALMVEFLC